MDAMEGIVPTTGVLSKLYDEAYGNEEYKASAFWQVFLQANFHEDLYFVVCESAPASNSRRRVDTIIRRYDPDHHTLNSLLFIDSKHSHGSRLEADEQVLGAARLAFESDLLASIYVMTTIGDGIPRRGSYNADNYVDAKSHLAVDLWTAISYMKACPPLGEAPVLLSNAPLPNSGIEQYGAYDDGEAADIDDQTNPTDLGEPSTENPGGPSTGQEGLDNSTILTPRQIMSRMLNKIFVHIRLERHTFGHDVVLFRDEKGVTRSSFLRDWHKRKINEFEMHVHKKYFTTELL
ncbi:uncharacterized protein SPSK_03547 [Sporothrix schenckii 1099-18]|uniref:Uncharacterized protein n=1 Tax=Sporothrix schenckii 1099-18 TaxID=1397361 RepID=A0A0F2M1V2_SPOSC|nr:uncharacterized protein SPSK_03547 [Sporothrix schenckii 1099-18]KJR82111.1 hypothetical protein SPSK_03547 [Sporothrix schenckii 1099-18]